ncbi:superoxide dismutase family protein [Cupriavidus taiwanensis]|uniref:Superoxide dismutase [Cu-Zn] n=2 Tax=Cupriavidus taiwanensis TaxID=164546 RepID=A0A375GCR3_9BURK|nr:superoxide dismutase family protein [Cupriavidus taiwanensis]SOZ10308.1 SUPEROXIDE DISMUTASE CU-ZN PRECURSOR PROTEIN [Cupriavidus taiwanensis]SOZ12477.1 SUPEROXIDE DISMUTASE CU-ZN PRECURSOR PROTEIN [Cupriavidus taiwanensis]SOZ43783.1 SUPEROXIDE DISMUTASE CU-ZN PRECURSOR PROTEIN [Cupriavidus taiwanensis]SPC16484.1 Superoxide dismutase (Cu-Zn) [Cupriavidus taiwanensis]SPC23024.1 SUPEROXIDE DISMUTASE CU-ZN PRECURSOR PROTEIN [Cupriavidus taiwanensis]
MKQVLLPLAACIAATLALAGCAGSGMTSSSAAQPSATGASGATSGARASATLQPKSGSNTAGTVTFQQQPGGVMMTAAITGLPPNSVHGFHVHEKGDCSAPDAMSAGGHFNPGGKPHGQMTMPDHHAGDMNNVTADANGNVRVSMLLPSLSVGTGANSVIGRAVVVHKDPDDYKTQPTGNAGGRIACGVVAAS